MKKVNEPKNDKSQDKLIDLLMIPLKKKLRKEYNRAQTAAINDFKRNGSINGDIWIEHRERIETITFKGFEKSVDAGFKYLTKTFIKAGWITEDDRKKYRKNLTFEFDRWIQRQATESAIETVKTTKFQVEWLLKKYQEADEALNGKQELNAFADIIKGALAEAKKRSIWRSVIGALAISHGGQNKGAFESVEQTYEDKKFNIFKIWQTRGDSKVRDTHQMMQGVSVLHNVAFDVPTGGGGTEQMRYPGDRNASIGNWINCRCRLRYKRGE